MFPCLQRTRRAMSLVGIPEKEQSAVFQTVAAVLHLGNVGFVDGPEQDSSQVPAGPSQKALEVAAQLLGVPPQGLARALTTRTRQTTDGRNKPQRVEWRQSPDCLWSICKQRHKHLRLGGFNCRLGVAGALSSYQEHRFYLMKL